MDAELPEQSERYRALGETKPLLSRFTLDLYPDGIGRHEEDHELEHAWQYRGRQIGCVVQLGITHHL